jgi:hypothetical protein
MSYVHNYLIDIRSALEAAAMWVKRDLISTYSVTKVILTLRKGPNFYDLRLAFDIAVLAAPSGQYWRKGHMVTLSH